MIGSLFMKKLLFLSRVVQIIKLNASLKLLNFEYNVTIGSLLSEVSNSLNFGILKTSLNGKASELHNSIAAPWRGKMSATGVGPFFFQDVGYLGILMIVSKFSEAFQPLPLFFLLVFSSGLINFK